MRCNCERSHETRLSIDVVRVAESICNSIVLLLEFSSYFPRTRVRFPSIEFNFSFPENSINYPVIAFFNSQIVTTGALNLCANIKKQSAKNSSLMITSKCRPVLLISLCVLSLAILCEFHSLEKKMNSYSGLFILITIVFHCYFAKSTISLIIDDAEPAVLNSLSGVTE